MDSYRPGTTPPDEISPDIDVLRAQFGITAPPAAPPVPNTPGDGIATDPASGRVVVIEQGRVTGAQG